MKLPAPDTTDAAHPWASASDRWPDDQRLRAAGWRLLTRGKGEPMWQKGPVRLLQHLALEVVAREDAHEQR